MIADTPACQRELHRIGNGLLRLELISQADSQAFNPAPAEHKQPSRWRLRDLHPPIPHIGPHGAHGGDTKMPTGGIRRYDDRQFEYRQKSRVFFDARLECWANDPHRVFGELDLARLAVEIEDTLHDWKHTPDMPGGLDPDKDTFLWRCMVADAPGTAAEVGKKYVLGRRTVERYRAQYRGIRKQAA